MAELDRQGQIHPTLHLGNKAPQDRHLNSNLQVVQGTGIQERQVLKVKIPLATLRM